MEFNILKDFSNAGQIPDNTGDTYLPKEVSAKIIEEIVAANVMRQFAQSVNVSGRTLSIPRILYGDSVNAYRMAYGVDVRTGHSDVNFTTEASVLEPQLVASFTTLLENDMETAGVDLAGYIRKSLAMTLARAEEKAMVIGDDTTPSGSYLTLFKGVYTIASTSDCATAPVTYSDSSDLVDKISDAIKALTVYGEDRGMLVLLCSNTFANKLRKSAKIDQVGTYNQNEVGVTRTGTLPKIHGVKIVESSVLETQESGECAVLMRVDGGIVGQRGGIIFRRKQNIESFSELLIMAEVIDYAWVLRNASNKALGMVLIHKASS